MFSFTIFGFALLPPLSHAAVERNKETNIIRGTREQCQQAITNFNTTSSIKTLTVAERVSFLRCLIDDSSLDVNLMETLVTSVVSNDPARYGMHLELGKCFGRQHLYSASARQYDRYFKSLSPGDLVKEKNIRLLIHHAENLHRLDQSRTAEGWFRKVLSIQDNLPPVHVELAVCLMLLGMQKEAAVLLQSVVQNNTSHTPAMFFLLRILEGLTEQEKLDTDFGKLEENLRDMVDSTSLASPSNICCADIGSSSKTCSSHIHGNESSRSANPSNCYSGFTIPSAEWKITRLDFPTDDEFDTFVRGREPLIISGAGSHGGEIFDKLGWTVEQWRHRDYLFKKAGEDVVWIEKKVGSLPFGFNSLKKQVNFSSFLDLVREPSSEWYLNTQGGDVISPPLTSLHQDLEEPSWLDGRDLESVNLWMGHAPNHSKGIASHLHHDYNDNLYVLIEGRKDFLLFSPADALNLYPVGKITHVRSDGLVDYAEQPSDWVKTWYPDNFSLLPTHLGAVDAQKWLGLNRATPARVSLQEGEMLFLPSGWWHQVTSYGSTIALNFWWKTTP